MCKVGRSECKQQETRENAEVARVVIESVTRRQSEVNAIALLELQSHVAGCRSVAAVIVEVEVENDWLVVLVEVETHVAFQEVCCCEAEEINAFDRSCENT